MVKKLTCMISMKMCQNDGSDWFIIDNFFDINKSFLGSLMTFKSVNQYTTLIPFFQKGNIGYEVFSEGLWN